MGKFDGYLFCTDLDDTLLTTDKRVSEKNKAAIQYFMDEGGLFTFATGRVYSGIGEIIKYIVPNAPMICFNGGCIYDIENKCEVWAAELADGAENVLKYVHDKFPFVGIEICTGNKIYFCRRNGFVDQHQKFENLPDNDMDYTQVQKPWRKLLFMMEECKVDVIRNDIAKSPYADTFTYVQSSPWYYEVLSKGCTKGSALLRLADILGIDRKKTIGMGDNENDIELVANAGIGAAVSNALDMVRSKADIITSDNNSDAVAELISKLDKMI